LCDCYGEPCKICGKMIPMHLGDFETDRIEIAAVCNDCLNAPKGMLGNAFTWLGAKRYCLWKCKGKDDHLGTVAVISLTDNAWENRDINHPNAGDIELVQQVDASASHAATAL